MKLSQDTLRKKMLGCFLGKSAGGTLGQPYEGWEGPLGLTYYDPVPTDMIPNDDLDLQVLWADCLARQAEPVVDRDLFGRAWVEHVHFPWSEYGIAIRNLKLGIPATWSGRYDNWFKDGLGAAIRSEIWACLAPGNPELAAKFMREDAMVDHVGEGVNAAVFLAVLESAAFVESDMEKLLDTALAAIPAECGIARAVRDADKLDIFPILLEYLAQPDNEAVVLNLKPSPELSPAVLSDMLAGRCPKLRDLKTKTDFLVAKLLWVNDLNFRHSLREFRRRDYVGQLAHYLPDTPEVRTIRAAVEAKLAEA